MRTAESVLFLCCPPGPDARYTSTRHCSNSARSSSCRYVSAEADDDADDDAAAFVAMSFVVVINVRLLPEVQGENEPHAPHSFLFILTTSSSREWSNHFPPAAAAIRTRKAAACLLRSASDDAIASQIDADVDGGRAALSNSIQRVCVCVFAHMKSMRGVLAMNVYVSEGRSESALRAFKEVAMSVSRVALVSSFVDVYYNRSSYTLAAFAQDVEELKEAAVKLAAAALERVDMRVHSAKHPRLGAVDHVSCHGLRGGSDTDAAAAGLAVSVGDALESRLQIPVRLYGSASGTSRGGSSSNSSMATEEVSLADVRRSLGYFDRAPSGDSSGDDEWIGLPPKVMALPGVDRKVGIACVGSVPWVTNFNVQLRTTDIKRAKTISDRLSSRGGGPPHVQTMALRHSSGLIEVACNLLNTDVTAPDVVEAHILQLAKAEAIDVVDSYTINPPVDVLVSRLEETLEDGEKSRGG